MTGRRRGMRIEAMWGAVVLTAIIVIVAAVVVGAWVMFR